MQPLKVTPVQAHLHWEHIKKNLQSFEKKLASVTDTDLVILPEMFNTGFSMKADQLAEPPDGPTTQWMEEQAQKREAVITGSLIIQENSHYYNRLIWMPPDGNYQTYDKRHLFRLMNEQEVYTAGQQRPIFQWKGWSICPQICYDLRFPVWSRNQPGNSATASDFDILFYNANWPEKRSYAWRHLLKARAIENQSFVIGVNRIGKDGHGVYHSGDSTILNPLGYPLLSLAHQASWPTLTLYPKTLKDIRKKFQFLRDADKFSILNE